MSWGIGWPFRLLRRSVTGASREELRRDSELLHSHRPADGGRSCIVGCRTRNYWSRSASAKLANIEDHLRSVTSLAARALKPDLIQWIGELAGPMAVQLEQHQAHKAWKTVWNAAAVLVSRLLSGGSVRYVSVHSQMIEVGRSWVFAASGKNPRRSGPWIEWITDCWALLGWVEETVAFSGSGRRLQKLAARRMLLLPRPLALMMTNRRLLETGVQHLLDWLEWQFLVPLWVFPDVEAQVYCLTAGRSEYIGFTAARNDVGKKHRTKLSGPFPGSGSTS